MSCTKEKITQFMAEEFPQSPFIIEKVGSKSSYVRLKINESNLRPGGTVSGPTVFAAADVSLYVAILGEIGLQGLTVTTNMNINFLRKPAADKDLVAECNLIKVGKVLVIGEVSIYSEGEKEPVAHATGTYSIPPKQ